MKQVMDALVTVRDLNDLIESMWETSVVNKIRQTLAYMPVGTKLN